MKTRKDSSKLTFILLRCILWILLLLAVFEAGRYVYSYGRAIFVDAAMTEPGTDEDVELLVLEGDNAKKVGMQLKEAGVISDGNLFYLQALLSDKNDNIKGGTYFFNSSMRPSKILDMLQEGPEAYQEKE